MKHTLLFKFLILLLTAICTVSVFAGGIGIVAMENSDLYVTDVSALKDVEYESIAKTIAQDYADLFAAETLGNLPYLLKKSMFNDPMDRGDTEHWNITLKEGDLLLAQQGDSISKIAYQKTYTLTPLYPFYYVEPEEPEPEVTAPTDETQETVETSPTEPTESSAPTDYLYRETETIWENGRLTSYELYYYEAPTYTITVTMEESVLNSSKLQILTDMYPYRHAFIGILVAGFILVIGGLAYLCWSAGRASDGTVKPGGLSLLPFDLYVVLSSGCIVGFWILFRRLSNWIQYEGPHLGNLSLAGSLMLAAAIVVLSLIYVLSAQVKMQAGFILRNSLIGRLVCLICRIIAFFFRSLARIASFMPVIWKWLLVSLVLVAGVFLLLPFALKGYPLFIVLLSVDILLCIGSVLYSGHALGSLIKGLQQMCDGDLEHKISTRYLRGSFLDLANHLNTLSETAMVSAENQMKSERMKSELITNISHDIKTPLTSIINFVDLLQKAPDPKAAQEYLQVLSRQSGRMKKLIDDLMELSKANSGNITAHITQIDAAESINQALGEFSDKLDSAHLEPVFQQPEQPVWMQADGRLVWRVLSNLLSNAVKYAMPGTRLYIELTKEQDQVLLSLKNVSRDALRIDADELMERFVRGDISRNSEGSGLGLNIAKSLMEIQNGQMQLLLDGDLFKVTLIFPAV